METSLHIEHVDEAVMQTLQQMAREEHVSVEEVVRQQLRKLSSHRAAETLPPRRHKNEIIREQAGRWSAEDLEEFERNTAPFREIDPELWK